MMIFCGPMSLRYESDWGMEEELSVHCTCQIWFFTPQSGTEAPPPPPPPGPQIEVTSVDLNPAEECAFEDGLGAVWMADAVRWAQDSIMIGMVRCQPHGGFCWPKTYCVDGLSNATGSRYQLAEATVY